MNTAQIISVLFSGSLLAGFLGALSGLGGGIIIVPLLVIALGADIHYAIGTSLIAVIATSSGASSAYVKEGFCHVKLGLFLETATTCGAIIGVIIGTRLPANLLSLLFGILLLYCAFSSFFANYKKQKDAIPNQIARWLELEGSYPTPQGNTIYQPERITLGYLIMALAGMLSAILGIGAGILKVLAMDKVMQLPFKVSTTTSNFMIGVTAAASAGIYLELGYIDPLLTAPVVLGVALGSLLGAGVLPYTKTKTLKRLFAILVLITGLQMIYKSFG